MGKLLNKKNCLENFIQEQLGNHLTKIELVYLGLLISAISTHVTITTSVRKDGTYVITSASTMSLVILRYCKTVIVTVYAIRSVQDVTSAIRSDDSLRSP